MLRRKMNSIYKKGKNYKYWWKEKKPILHQLFYSWYENIFKLLMTTFTIIYHVLL